MGKWVESWKLFLYAGYEPFVSCADCVCLYHSVAGFLTLLMVSLDEQKFSIYYFFF